MLTTAQLHELAATLRDTRQNVFVVAKKLFGVDVDVDDGVFDKLTAVCDLFKCDECGCWADTDEEDRNGICVPCAAWIAAGVE